MAFHLIAPVWEHAHRILVLVNEMQPLLKNVFNYTCTFPAWLYDHRLRTSATQHLSPPYASHFWIGCSLPSPYTLIHFLRFFSPTSYNPTTLQHLLSCLLLVKCDAVSSASCWTRAFHFLLAPQLAYRPGYYLPPWLIFLGWHINDIIIRGHWVVVGGAYSERSSLSRKKKAKRVWRHSAEKESSLRGE